MSENAEEVKTAERKTPKLSKLLIAQRKLRFGNSLFKKKRVGSMFARSLRNAGLNPNDFRKGASANLLLAAIIKYEATKVARLANMTVACHGKGITVTPERMQNVISSYTSENYFTPATDLSVFKRASVKTDKKQRKK